MCLNEIILSLFPEVSEYESMVNWEGLINEPCKYVHNHAVLLPQSNHRLLEIDQMINEFRILV